MNQIKMRTVSCTCAVQKKTRLDEWTHDCIKIWPANQTTKKIK
jgi:hypothetical protein